MIRAVSDKSFSFSELIKSFKKIKSKKERTNKMSEDRERFKFRMIRQGSDSFEGFVKNLRTQIAKCNYTDPESQLKDQIIEKCRNRELQELAFQQKMSIDQLITTAKTLEFIEQRSAANALNNNRCTRCNEFDHRTSGTKCRAWSFYCSQCKKRGHLTECCLDIRKKRRHPNGEIPNERATKFVRFSNGTSSTSERQSGSGDLIKASSIPKTNEADRQPCENILTPDAANIRPEPFAQVNNFSQSSSGGGSDRMFEL